MRTTPLPLRADLCQSCFDTLDHCCQPPAPTHAQQSLHILTSTRFSAPPAHPRAHEPALPSPCLAHPQPHSHLNSARAEYKSRQDSREGAIGGAGVSALRAMGSRRALTPRPSISPLSSAASRTRKLSLEALDIPKMKDLEDFDDPEADNVMEDAAEAEAGEQHNDDGSSSLSEPEDEHSESEDPNGVYDDMLDGLEHTAQHVVDADSEAETERLEQTPQKPRKHADNLGRTPSKLSQAATADDDVSEPASPVPAGVGAASSTSTLATGQKRKRSDTADSSLTSAESDIGDSPRKRAHDAGSKSRLRADVEIDDLERVQESAEHVDHTTTLHEARDTPPIQRKGWGKGRKGKPKGRKPKEQPVQEDVDIEPTEEPAELPEEPSEEDPVKTEEQLKAKKEASAIYDHLTKEFRAFREKMYNERLSSLSHDLALLAEPECVHPEYLRQVACVDVRLQKQISEAHAYYNYKLRCIRERTLGERSQLHSQYFQLIREQREDVLYKLGEDWYAIQKERRQSHADEDNAFHKFPTKRAAQIRFQAKYNQEVSVLAGIAKFVGFPAAPDIGGVEVEGVDEDMRAMKISKRPPQPAVPPPLSRPVYMVGANPGFSQNERLAHEKYLEQTPWARPQAQVPVLHAHATPGLTHTPDWAEPQGPGTHSSAAATVGNPFARVQHSSPFATPIPAKQAPLQFEQERREAFAGERDREGVDVGSEPLASSVVAAPPTTDRMASFMHHQHPPAGGASSVQTSPLAFPKVRENGTTAAALASFRNISGTSTIDAPQEMESEARKPAAAPQAFESSQMHSHPRDEMTEYGGGVVAGFRPQEGAFGTPAPLLGGGAAAS